MVRCTGQPRRHTRDRWFNPYSLCGVPATLCLQRTIVTHDTSVVGVLHGPVYDKVLSLESKFRIVAQIRPRVNSGASGTLSNRFLAS